MNAVKVKELVDFINVNKELNKKELILATVTHFGLLKVGSAYVHPDFTVRFSSSKRDSAKFSNTVLALSNLKKYDDKPFFVCLAAPNENYILLANSTFLSKISHSSKELRLDNIKGSFNGGDILANYEGLENCPVNFADLFAKHKTVGFDNNLERLVTSTSGIQGTLSRYKPTLQDLKNIEHSAIRTYDFIRSKDYGEVLSDLNSRVAQVKDEIIHVSKTEDNVNLRGRMIEDLVNGATEGDLFTDNSLNDYEAITEKYHVGVDIKSKMLYSNSAPKGYNIDKFLKFSAEVDTVYLVYFIGVDENDEIYTQLVPAYDNELLEMSNIQTHWSGRNSRGTVQYSGSGLKSMITEPRANRVNLSRVITWLNYLLNL